MELVGATVSGKTQLCMAATAAAAISSSTSPLSGDRIVYFDTNGSFCPKVRNLVGHVTFKFAADLAGQSNALVR